MVVVSPQIDCVARLRFASLCRRFLFYSGVHSVGRTYGPAPYPTAPARDRSYPRPRRGRPGGARRGRAVSKMPRVVPRGDHATFRTLGGPADTPRSYEKPGKTPEGRPQADLRGLETNASRRPTPSRTLGGPADTPRSYEKPGKTPEGRPQADSGCLETNASRTPTLAGHQRTGHSGDLRTPRGPMNNPGGPRRVGPKPTSGCLETNTNRTL